MLTCFGSVEEAKGYTMAVLGLDVAEGFSFEEIDPKPVGTFGAELLVKKAESADATEPDEAVATSIKDTASAQRIFRIMKDGEEHDFPLRKPINGKNTAKFIITIDPFLDGFDCWLVAPTTGMAQRL